VPSSELSIGRWTTFHKTKRLSIDNFSALAFTSSLQAALICLVELSVVLLSIWMTFHGCLKLAMKLFHHAVHLWTVCYRSQMYDSRQFAQLMEEMWFQLTFLISYDSISINPSFIKCSFLSEIDIVVISMWTWSNLLDDLANVPCGAVICRMIFTCWHCTQIRAQFRQSTLIDGQTYRCVMSLIVALIPRWARLWMLLNAAHRKDLVKNILSIPIEVSQKIATPSGDIDLFKS